MVPRHLLQTGRKQQVTHHDKNHGMQDHQPGQTLPVSLPGKTEQGIAAVLGCKQRQHQHAEADIATAQVVIR